MRYQAMKDIKESQMHTIKRKKPIQKGYILYDFNYMTNWERWNYGGNKNISGFQVLVRKEE